MSELPHVRTALESESWMRKFTFDPILRLRLRAAIMTVQGEKEAAVQLLTSELRAREDELPKFRIPLEIALRRISERPN